MARAVALISEYLGTLFLVLAVVGSGIMAENLSEDIGLQLLINAAGTVAMLYILINLLAPLSGAHFNPAVTLVAALRKEIALRKIAPYLFAQILGAISGSSLAQILFERELLEISSKERTGTHLLIAEVVATFGLLFIVFADWKKFKLRERASLISLWIGAAYFFTSSTSFANPAVTIGRIFSDSFAGISPASVAPFIGAQLIGALLAFLLLLVMKSNQEGEKTS